MKKANAALPDASMDALFQKWGTAYGVDPLLIKSHATVESGLNANAVNPADPSYGLMQVLCRHGADGACQNKFNVNGWSGMTTKKLLDPDTNIKIAAQIMSYNIRAYGMPRAVAVYNSWDQRHAPLNGPFKNQNYVDRVLAIYEGLGGGA